MDEVNLMSSKDRNREILYFLSRSEQPYMVVMPFVLRAHQVYLVENDHCLLAVLCQELIIKLREASSRCSAFKQV